MSDNDIAIIGIGETESVRRSDESVRSTTLRAVLAAIEDAGLTPKDIDGIVTDSVIMPTTVPHEWIAGQLGIDRGFDGSISYGGAGIVGAPLIARSALRAGDAKYVLCYFGVDWGSKPGGPYAFHDLYPAKLAFEKPYGFNAQPSYFALWAQRYAYQFGLRREHLGAIAVSQRANSIRTGRGQNMKPMDMAGYLNSPPVSDPLHYPDCCLISDGAVAFVMTTGDRARDVPKPPVYVRGIGFGSEGITGDDVFTQKPDLMALPGAALARERLRRDSGLDSTDADFAEIYDCFTISCLMQTEDLGFCEKGEGGDFALDGHTALGGSMPVNTHGGLLSYSYRLGAEHVTEAVRQIRGEAGDVQLTKADLGVVTGLSVPDYAILLLGR
jgi:acetyl-CoA acetyltransferase